MQAHFLRYSCEIFTTKTCYVENKNIRLSIEKMRKMMLVMLRMRMCCCRTTGGGSSNRLFTTGGFIIVPPSCTIRPFTSIFPILFSPAPFLAHFPLILLFSYSFLLPVLLFLIHLHYFLFSSFIYYSFFISAITFAPVLHIYPPLLYFS